MEDMHVPLVDDDSKIKPTLPKKQHLISGPSKVTDFQSYTVQYPHTIDQFLPDASRTQIGIAKQGRDSFLVRFIVDPDNPRSDRHSFMLEYKAPRELFGKPLMGNIILAGDSPQSMSIYF